MPVTPTWKVPTEVKVHERVELPEPVTLVGDNEHEVLLVVNATTPANPLTGLTVTVEVPADPTLTVTEVGAAVIAKSWTTNVATAL